MSSTPVLVVGGTTQSDPGETVVGHAKNHTQTDSYIAYGYNNVIIENGGNLIVAPAPTLSNPAFGLTPNRYTTIELGNAVGVTDTIQLLGFHNTILQKAGTSLTGGSSVQVTLEEGFQGFDTVDLVNRGGSNAIDLFTTTNETVKLVGATNTVTTGSYSTVTVNGNANNNIVIGSSTVTIGSHDDKMFGYTTTMLLGGGGNTVTAGDENVSIQGNQAQGSNNIMLGNGANRLMIAGTNNNITVGDGTNAITLLGGTSQITVNATRDRGFDTIQLGSGSGDAVMLGAAAALITGTGPGTTTITQTASSRSMATIDLGGGTGAITLGSGNDVITANGAGTTITARNGNDTITALGGSLAQSDTVQVGNGANTVTVGAYTAVLLGAGHNTVTTGANAIVHAVAGQDTIALGDNSRAIVTGTHSSHTTVTLANDDVVSAVGGIETISGGTNATVFFDGAEAGTMVTFSDKDDQLYLGSNASARVFLNQAGGDLVSVQALDATGAYTGRVNITSFAASDVLYLRGLEGGVVAEALNSFAAVLANLTTAGGNEVLHLQGGGQIVFAGHVPLQASEFQFVAQYGTVVPTGV